MVPVEMVVDTGYVGTITLPSAIVRTLMLPFLRRSGAKLADGSSIMTDVFAANILWHDVEVEAELLSLDDRPLLGMLLLNGSNMNVVFENGGVMDLAEIV